MFSSDTKSARGSHTLGRTSDSSISPDVDAVGDARDQIHPFQYPNAFNRPSQQFLLDRCGMDDGSVVTCLMTSYCT